MKGIFQRLLCPVICAGKKGGNVNRRGRQTAVDLRERTNVLRAKVSLTLARPVSVTN